MTIAFLSKILSNKKEPSLEFLNSHSLIKKFCSLQRRDMLNKLDCFGNINPSPQPSPARGEGENTAFTLAEVLITLGVIGVVAAMTMPALIQNHRKQVVETRLAKFYSVMSQAIKLAEVNEGDKKDWDLTEYGYYKADGESEEEEIQAFFDRFLAPYISYSKVEPCSLSTLHNNKFLCVYFADGSVLSIKDKLRDFDFYIDKKALTNSKVGVNTFYFKFIPSLIPDKVTYEGQLYHYGFGIEPFAENWDGEYETLSNGSSSYSCDRNKRKHYCTKLIQANNWKIPKDYPLKF